MGWNGVTIEITVYRFLKSLIVTDVNFKRMFDLISEVPMNMFVKTFIKGDYNLLKNYRKDDIFIENCITENYTEIFDSFTYYYDECDNYLEQKWKVIPTEIDKYDYFVFLNMRTDSYPGIFPASSVVIRILGDISKTNAFWNDELTFARINRGIKVYILPVGNNYIDSDSD